MAENEDFICQSLAAYLAKKLDARVEPVLDIPWQAREELFDAGEIDLCWLCGLPYVQKADQLDAQLALLAAPVMQGARYRNRPVYFSDVVVLVDSPFYSFADLRGASWAYNEPNSHSGYNVARYHLATLGEASGYFGRAVGSGAHQASLRMILAGEVDASAIDSIVLALELRRYPEIRSQIRVIETLGPSPIPPWCVAKGVDVGVQKAVQTLLLIMHEDAEGRAVLDEAGIARFVAVEDQGYDAIREMDRLASQARL